MPFYAQRHQLARLQLAVGSTLAVVTKRLGWYTSADEIGDQLAGGANEDAPASQPSDDRDCGLALPPVAAPCPSQHA